MQRIILDALVGAQNGKTSITMLEQYETVLDNTGREFDRVEEFSEKNLYEQGISARILDSSYRVPNHDALLCQSFSLGESSVDLESEKLAILKGESRKWLACRVNLSTLGIDLVAIRRDPEIFQEEDCNKLAWKQRHLRYMHFGSDISEKLLLNVRGKYFLYQRQAIACFSSGHRSGLIQSECLLFDDFTKFWRLQTCYNCQGKYAEKSSQLWHKTVYSKAIAER